MTAMCLMDEPLQRRSMQELTSLDMTEKDEVCIPETLNVNESYRSHF
jgi:hypothetical protein